MVLLFRPLAEAHLTAVGVELAVLVAVEVLVMAPLGLMAVAVEEAFIPPRTTVVGTAVPTVAAVARMLQHREQKAHTAALVDDKSLVLPGQIPLD